MRSRPTPTSWSRPRRAPRTRARDTSSKSSKGAANCRARPGDRLEVAWIPTADELQHLIREPAVYALLLSAHRAGRLPPARIDVRPLDVVARPGRGDGVHRAEECEEPAHPFLRVVEERWGLLRIDPPEAE